MTISLYEIEQALIEARNIQRRADTAASQAARLLRGRLRHCNHEDLECLKKELKDFNIQTCRWKELGK
jgi:hypothetical protein